MPDTGLLFVIAIVVISIAFKIRNAYKKKQMQEIEIKNAIASLENQIKKEAIAIVSMDKHFNDNPIEYRHRIHLKNYVLSELTKNINSYNNVIISDATLFFTNRAMFATKVLQDGTIVALTSMFELANEMQNSSLEYRTLKIFPQEMTYAKNRAYLAFYTALYYEYVCDSISAHCLDISKSTNYEKTHDALAISLETSNIVYNLVKSSSTIMDQADD